MVLCQVTKDICHSKINTKNINPQLMLETTSSKSIKPQSLLEQTVLIVEDNSDLQFLYQMLLKKAGWKITGTAMNGFSAVETYLALPRKPAIIILDILLPGYSGITVAREILKHSPDQKILFISGNCRLAESEPDLEHIPRISKPFEFNKLLMKLEEMINHPKLGEFSQ